MRSLPASFPKKPCFPFAGPAGAGAADLVSRSPSVLGRFERKISQGGRSVSRRFSSSGGAALSVPMAGGAFRFSADRGMASPGPSFRGARLRGGDLPSRGGGVNQ